jgi:uncharacterized protein
VKLLVFSDIHGDRTALNRLLAMEADYYFAAGDLVSWGRGLEQMGELLQRRAERMYVLPGNHESPEDITRICERFGLHDFHGVHFEADGWHIAGLGCSTPTPFNTPGEYSEPEMQERLEPFESLDPLVLICHCPPRNTALDRIHKGLHAGSTAVHEFIDRRQPAHFLCGHIHECAGVTVQMGNTRAMNVGKAGFLLEL